MMRQMVGGGLKNNGGMYDMNTAEGFVVRSWVSEHRKTA